MESLSIVIVTYNSANEIEPCLNSVLRATASLDAEIIVIDNLSKDDTVVRVRNSFPGVRAIQNMVNAGFPAANNQGFAIASGNYILMLNPDTVIEEDAIYKMLSFLLRNPHVGICGPRLVDSDGRPAGALWRPSFVWMVMNILGLLKLPIWPEGGGQSPWAVSGAALMFRRNTLEEIGLLDEDMFWGEDGDFCLRARAKGWEIRRVESATIIHMIGRSTSSNMALYIEKYYTSKIRFLNKHSRRFEYSLCSPIFRIEAGLRWIKWSLLSMFSPSDEASLRKAAFRRMCIEMPRFFRSEYKRP